MRLGIFLSAVLGFAISTGSSFGLAVSIIAPLVWVRQKSRASCYICAFSYYLSALYELTIVSRNFFGPESGLLGGVCLWTVAAGLLSLPWLWAWASVPAAAIWRVPLALLASVIPPLGLIGWASPVAAAGLLFPGAEFAGFVLVLFLPAVLLNTGALGRLGIASAIVVLHLVPTSQPQPPSDWEAIDTNFGSVGHGSADLARDYEVVTQLQRYVAQSKARVLIFPEAVAPKWFGDALQSESKSVLAGSVVPKSARFDFGSALHALKSEPTSTSTGGVEIYSNKLLIRGAETSEFDQRVPVPIGMWKPFTHSGVPLNLSGPGTTLIAGRRIAVLICYEQLIAWPALASFTERPSFVVAVSNNVWVSNTSIPKVERTMVLAWAALFNVPALFASNA